MDINTIDDIKELKSLAYDQLAQIEISQSNLRAINERLAQLNKEEEEEA